MKSLNKHSQWRLALAKDIFNKLEKNKKLVSFFVGGSVSRNYADEYSDLEICFVWKTEISEAERNLLYNEIGFQKINLNNILNTVPFEDTLYLKELQIDIWHLTEKNIQNTINSVLIDFEVNISKSNLLETLQTCIPIYGEKYIFELRQKIKLFPNALAEKIIKQFTKDFFLIDIDMFIKRKDWVVVYRYIPTFQRLIILVLEAINKQYHTSLGFKRLNKSIKKLAICPKDMHVFSNLDKMKPSEAWSEVTRLKLETIELIKTHYPNIDLTYIEKNKMNRRAKITNHYNFL